MEAARIWFRLSAAAAALVLAACSGLGSSTHSDPSVADAASAAPPGASDASPTAPSPPSLHGVRSGLLGERQSVPLTSENSVSEHQPPSPPAVTVTGGATSPIVSIAVRGYAFPKEVRITPGSQVVWLNVDSAGHDVTGFSGRWASPVLGAGATYTRNFTEPGLYRYLCTIHPFMQGTLIVE